MNRSEKQSACTVKPQAEVKGDTYTAWATGVIAKGKRRTAADKLADAKAAKARLVEMIGMDPAVAEGKTFFDLLRLAANAK